MKTKLLLIVAICMLITSCTKETYTLTGSTWESAIKPEEGAVGILEFESNICIFSLMYNGKTYETSSYDYVLNYPDVMMYAKEEGIADLEGTIYETMMTVRNISKNIYFNPFYRRN